MKRFLQSSMLSIMMLFLFGCSAPEAAVKGPKPLYLGLAYDVTGSAAELPPITAKHVGEVVDLARRRGGTVAFCLIHEKAIEPLDRLVVLPIRGRLDERAKVAVMDRERADNWKSLVTTKVAHPRNARLTDFEGVISRFALFFGEPTVPQFADSWLLIVSDGIQTAPGHGRANLPRGVKVLVVGMDPGVAHKRFGNAVTVLESVDAAISVISQGE